MADVVIEWTTIEGPEGCQTIKEGRIDGRLVALDIGA